MTPTDPPSIDRLHDLLAQRATEGLTATEESELARLVEKWPHLAEDSLELAAAALTTAEVAPEPLPPHLLRALERDMARHVESRPRRGATPSFAILGWALAAGILCAVGILQFWPRALPADARRYAADVAEVRWSPSAQEGTLTVRGLPPNNPSQSQYQLWIIDEGRGRPGQVDANNRVDAGVFDVQPDGTASVRIKPSVRVFNASAFAVTKEPPGGVIVSRAAENVKAILKPVAGS